MSAVVKHEADSNYDQAIEKALIKGDLVGLSEQHRIAYYFKMCERYGLDPYTQPFSLIKLDGRLVLYANKTCTDQLRAKQKISIEITSTAMVGDVYVVTTKATMPDGRTDSSTGAVYIGKNSGEALANLYLKAETKAKRRVTLSISGLGMLDESEVESIPNAEIVKHEVMIEIPVTDAQLESIRASLVALGLHWTDPKAVKRLHEITGKIPSEWTQADAQKVQLALDVSLTKKHAEGK